MSDADLLARLCCAACCPDGCAHPTAIGLCSARRLGSARVLAVLTELEANVTEGMVKAGFNARPLPTMRAAMGHYRLALQAALRHLIDQMKDARDE